MKSSCPRLIIGGTGSGVGKTSIALGLVRALARKDRQTQTFKVGPDFLDPTYLAMASGRPCHSLDGWMTSHDYTRELFVRATGDADFAVIEGVMGLFDGASPVSLEGSTAEAALLLESPVLLVASAHGASRSVAATVKGFVELEPRIRVAGVIANHVGSRGHAEWLGESLAAAGLPPLVGAVKRDSLPKLQSRHLGLFTADNQSFPERLLEQLADAVEAQLDMERIAKLAAEAPAIEVPTDAAAEKRPATRVRIGLARDAAFHFYYPDNIGLLELAGAEIVEFSPLADSALPSNLDGLYIGGGYPETHMDKLSNNKSMLQAVREFAASGRPLYAECGGLMYLGRSIRAPDGKAAPMAGALPIETELLSSRQSLGYVEATPSSDCFLAERGQTLRGHEFHYSRIVCDDSAADGWRKAYSLRRRRTDAAEPEGFQKGNVLASYVHLRFASRPGAARRFVETCGENQESEFSSQRTEKGTAD